MDRIENRELGARESLPRNTLREILKDFEIPQLSSLEAGVTVVGKKGGRVLLAEVLGSPRDKYLEEPQKKLAQRGEDNQKERPHGKPRSSTQKKRIREDYERLGRRLRENGPGWLMAAIAANNGREAEWFEHGITGNEDWQEPSEAEKAWWVWVYRLERRDVEIEKWWENRTGELLHAFFIMRHRGTFSEVSPTTFQEFIDRISPVIPEDKQITQYLLEITGKFTP